MSLVVTKVCQEVDLVPLWTCTFAVVKDQVLSSWLVIFRPVTRSCHPWSSSAITPPSWDQKNYAAFAPDSTSTAQHQVYFTTNCYKNQCWSQYQQNEDVCISDQPKPIGWIGQTQLLWLSDPCILGILRNLKYLVWFSWLLVVLWICCLSACDCLLCVWLI
jgi:hypothetical protein